MAYDFGQPFRGYQPTQGNLPYQPTTFLPQTAAAPVAPQTAPQQGFSIRPVASREEAMAIQTDFFGPGIIMPCLGQGVIWLKRFNPNTGASDLLEFVYAPPQIKPDPAQEYVTMEQYHQLLYKIEQLEKGVTANDAHE